MPTKRRFEVLDVAEVADLLHVSMSVVYRLIHEGEFEAIRIGRLYRITPESLEEFISRS